MDFEENVSLGDSSSQHIDCGTLTYSLSSLISLWFFGFDTVVIPSKLVMKWLTSVNSTWLLAHWIDSLGFSFYMSKAKA